MSAHTLKIGLAFLASATAIPAAAAVVDIDALDPAGTTVALAAGTYTVTYAGIAGGGLYDAFSYWPETNGCDSDGANCTRGWTNHFAIDLGGGAGTGYGLASTTGFRGVWDTPARALTEYSTRTLQSATLAQINNDRNYFLNGGNAYTDVVGPITFTLASAQDVRFFVIDSPLTDNRGGVSLNVAAIPEPATWAMMIAGFGLAGAAMRKRPRVRVLA